LKENSVASSVQKYARLGCRIPDIPSKSIRHEKNRKKLRGRKQDFHREERGADREESREQHQGMLQRNREDGQNAKQKPEDEE